MAGCHRGRCSSWVEWTRLHRTSFATTGCERERTIDSSPSSRCRSIPSTVAITHDEPLEGYTLRLQFDRA